MAIDSHTKNLIRMGRVSSTDPGTMTVKVVFEDKDNLVSDSIPVLARGSSRNKDYWLPDVGEQVCCLMLPNGHNAGICLGSYYSESDPSGRYGQDVRRIDFGDGTYLSYNRASHELEINCVGHVVIQGQIVDINPPGKRNIWQTIKELGGENYAGSMQERGSDNGDM